MPKRIIPSALLALLAVCALAVAPAVRGASNSDYMIGAGDLLRISVFGYPDMGIDARVSESGNIGYPFLGQITVGGLSTAQAEDLIATRLKEAAIVKMPQVSLLVVDFQSQKISVMGQVNKPGQYPLDKTSTVIDALAEAGGTVTILAADEATLLRKDGSKQIIDLKALFEGDPTQNPQVKAGDTLFVPKAPQFYIQGEVQKPGMYRLERGMTVSQAISAGGGLTARGSARRIVAKRRDEKGVVETGSIKGSDPVVPDDVLIVKESLF